MRILIDIPNDDLAIINAVAKALSISRTEFVRRAIAKYLTAHRQTQIQEARKAAFGLLAGRSIDGMEYQERIRQEWE
jgi:metal-responsive CopG/Arc/MetJ family transcriptional regulator